MKTMNHKSTTRERVSTPDAHTERSKRRAFKRKADKLRKRQQLKEHDQRAVKFHF